MTYWRPEEDPAWSIAKLRELATKPCVEFKERVAAGNKYQFCSRCESCISSQALILIIRERIDVPAT